MIADSYVTPQEAVGLMTDDVVEFFLQRHGRKITAKIRRVVQRGRTKVLGQISFDHPSVLVTSDNNAFAVGGRPPKKGNWVLAEIEKFPSVRSMGTVRVCETLGSRLEPKHDTTIAISLFGLRNPFDRETLRQSDAITLKLNGGPGRKDLSRLPFVTIDGEDAKDFDDAVCVVTPSQGAVFVLYVSIADVSAYVPDSSLLDDEAKKRGTSVYLPGRCLPMLPEVLSNHLCSLKPREPKLCVTCEIHYDRDGNVILSRFYESMIQTIRRLTYTEVGAFFENDPTAKTNLSPVAHELSKMRSLYKRLAQQRKSRGTLDFDLPECEIELDTDERPINIRKAPRNDSHRLIEEFMIAANQEVARALREAKISTLYRVHAPPAPDSIDEINHWLKSLGISDRITEITPRAFSNILKKTEHSKNAHTLHPLILRCQKQACYEPNPKGHFGLALEDYTHFTSPIRRYPDLMVHRSLKKLIHHDKYSEKRNENDWVQLGILTSQTERRAMMAERFVVKRKQCWFMKEKVGKQFDGRVSWVSPNGLFVEIAHYALEGFLPAGSLGSLEFEESCLCFRGSSGKRIGIGDKISVSVANVSMEANQITFALNPVT